jgi:hypothetical protein
MARWLLLALALVASGAHADGRICLSRDVITFGDRAVGTSVTQSATVSNCGDAPFTLSNVSLHPATSSAFRVASACSSGQSLAPGQSCTIDVTFAPTAAGQASGAVWLYNTTVTGSQLVTFYGRGVDASAGSATLAIAPSPLDFGAQDVGTTASARSLELTNLGPSSMTLAAIVLNGPAAHDFAYDESGECWVGITLPAGRSCRVALRFTPAAAGLRPAQLNVDAPELASLRTVAVRGTGVVAATTPSPVDVVEFHHAALDHYFMTADPVEAAALDAGALGPAWTRTGHAFKAYAAGTQGGGALDVCRFFGTPGVGPSSHFFTGHAPECAAVRDSPHWIDEGLAFRAIVPVDGLCPVGLAPVVRFFRPGGAIVASRHRYARDVAVIAAMRAAGWIDEGPVFCSAR